MVEIADQVGRGRKPGVIGSGRPPASTPSLAKMAGGAKPTAGMAPGLLQQKTIPIPQKPADTGRSQIQALRRWRLAASGLMAIALVVLLAWTVGSIAATLSGLASALDAAMARRALVAEVESALRAELASAAIADAQGAAAYRERATNAARLLAEIHDRLTRDAGPRAALFYAEPLRPEGVSGGASGMSGNSVALPGAQSLTGGPGEPAGFAMNRAIGEIDRAVKSVGRLAPGNPAVERLLRHLPVLAQAFEAATRAHIDDAYDTLYRRVYVQLGLVTLAVLGLGLEHIMVFRPMIRRFEAALSEVEAARDRMTMAARIDALTGLWNRSVLREAMDREIKRAMRHGTVSLLALDIDFFKKVNDTHGHPGGDEVLKAVAQVMAASVRDVDSACRIGGEEFFIVLPDTAPAGAAVVAERIRKAVMGRAVPLKSGESVRVTVSIGIASYPPEGAERPRFGGPATPVASLVDTLFNDADQRLYEAKHAGRNCVRPAPADASPSASTPPVRAAAPRAASAKP